MIYKFVDVIIVPGGNIKLPDTSAYMLRNGEKLKDTVKLFKQAAKYTEAQLALNSNNDAEVVFVVRIHAIRNPRISSKPAKL